MTDTPKQQPEVCPHCGKLGFKTETDSQTYYVHRNTVGPITAFDPVSFGFDYCPKPSSVSLPNKAPQK